MQIETSGILISLRPFSERDVIAHIFTRDNGVLVGMLRGGAVAKKNKPLVGQYGNLSWNARVDSQLGVFHFESEKNFLNESLEDIETAIRNNIEVDMIEIDIKSIWELLGKLIGEIYDDELIDNIFNRFCLGK